MWRWFILVLYICTKKCSPQLVYKETLDISYQIEELLKSRLEELNKQSFFIHFEKICTLYDHICMRVAVTILMTAGIFESGAHTQRRAFNESMRHANVGDWRLDPIIIQPERNDSYSVWKAMCSNDAMRPIAIIGPQNPISDGAIRDQCAIANIPHIQATWQPLDPEIELNEEITEELETQEETETNEVNEDNSEEPSKPEFKKISINFYPDSHEIAMAYAKLLKYYKWENFAALYEDEFGLLRIQKILAEHTTKYPVTVRHLDSAGDNYKIFKELSKFQESRILVDCHVDRVLKYMEEARALNMLNHYQHYILVTMDASTLADDLSVLLSNVTWLSITEFDQLKDAQHYLSQRVGKWTSDKLNLPPPVTEFETEALMMDDIAKHVLKALQNVEAVRKVKKPSNFPCEANADPWPYGAMLQNMILKTKSVGVTGNIEFDETGKRVNYTLYVNEIYVSKRQTVGRWQSMNPDSIIEDRPSVEFAIKQSSKQFIVISRKAKPYFYDKEKCEGDDCEDDEPEEKFEGFSVDLVKHIFQIMKAEMNYSYTYRFVHDEDKTYGKYNAQTKKWNGLIGDLLDKKADLAVCDLTITEERKKVVDFSVPFMSLGISILYTKEIKVVPGMFSFLNPYSIEVWMYTATAYCVVSIVLFVCSRISPADWENPQPCDKDPEELENIWNFKNCTWLTMGSIMTQGCDILPKAVGSRWVCGMWWFFAMIVCQTYIAQLAASLTSASESEPINSVEDLARQTKILYGAFDGGSTLEFFKNSKDKMYRKMYENMKANPVVLVGSNDEGEKRVLNGKNKYAFFMESCTIEYKLKRNCNLKKVGGELDSKDYGIAMPANSPFRSQINTAILRLKELTILDEIKKKWWEQKYGAMQCEEEKDENDEEDDLEIENLTGAFLVLIVGLVFCLFITAAEFMNEVRNIVVREQVTHKEAFIKELKASLNFFQLQKPVLRNPSRAPSIASSNDSEEKQQKRSAVIENFIDFEKELQ